MTTYEKILEKTHTMPRAQLIDALVKAMEFCDEPKLVKLLAHIYVTEEIVALTPQTQPVAK